jgi:hypothetical protein
MPIDTDKGEKAIQLLIKARGSSRGNTGSTPHVESGESPVSHESSKIPILVSELLFSLFFVYREDNIFSLTARSNFCAFCSHFTIINSQYKHF